jgi:hypothetical protein
VAMSSRSAIIATNMIDIPSRRLRSVDHCEVHGRSTNPFSWGPREVHSRPRVHAYARMGPHKSTGVIFVDLGDGL